MKLKNQYMRVISVIMLSFAVLSVGAVTFSADWNIVPSFSSVEYVKESPFHLSQTTIIAYPQSNPELEHYAMIFSSGISELLGYELEVRDVSEDFRADDMIMLRTDHKINNNEAFSIDVDTHSVILRGGSEAGVFYALQSLLKAVPLNKKKTPVMLSLNSGNTVMKNSPSVSVEIDFPAVYIYGEPRCSVRGVIVNSKAEYLPIDRLKEILDLLAYHGMNTLYWQVADNDDWQVNLNSVDFDGTVKKIYSQSQVEDVVRYASSLNIRVIPKIDVSIKSELTDSLQIAMNELQKLFSVDEILVGDKSGFSQNVLELPKVVWLEDEMIYQSDNQQVIKVPECYEMTVVADDMPFEENRSVTFSDLYYYEPEEGLSEKQSLTGLVGTLSIDAPVSRQNLMRTMLPKLAFTAQSQWSKRRNKAEFIGALWAMLQKYDFRGYAYSREIYEINAEYKVRRDLSGVEVKLSKFDDNALISYTHPSFENASVYTEPFIITSSGALSASAVYASGERSEFSKEFNFNKATMAPVEILTDNIVKTEFAPNIDVLVDGMRGDDRYAGSGDWLVFNAVPTEIIIDLGKSEKVSQISMSAFADASFGKVSVSEMEVMKSDDGLNFETVHDLTSNIETVAYGIQSVEAKTKSLKTRYVKLKIIPSNRSGYEDKYLLIDEIIIN